MTAVTAAERTLLHTVRADPVAFGLLQMKARGERRSLYAVLRDFGDPRGWADYRSDHAAMFAKR